MYEINCYDSYGNTIDYLTQWDYNRKLIMYIDNYDLSYAPEVHFCNQNSVEALVVQSVVEGNKLTVDIPNILLQEHLALCAYVYLSDANNAASQKTILSVAIPVRYRPKPSDYTYIENIDKVTAATIEQSVYDKVRTSVRDVVFEYLDDNPIVGGATPEQAQQIENNTANVNQLSGTVNSMLNILKSDSQLYEFYGVDRNEYPYMVVSHVFSTAPTGHYTLGIAFSKTIRLVGPTLSYVMEEVLCRSFNVGSTNLIPNFSDYAEMFSVLTGTIKRSNIGNGKEFQFYFSNNESRISEYYTNFDIPYGNAPIYKLAVAPDIGQLVEDVGQLQDTVNDLKNNGTTGSGLSSTEKSLMITLFRNMLSDTDMTETVDTLETLWSGGSVEQDSYTIKYNLTNATSSENVPSVASGSSFTTTLSAMDGFKLNTVLITMNGIDVTDSVYSDGVVTIPKVTGNVVVSAIGISNSDAQAWEDGVAYTITPIVGESVDDNTGEFKTGASWHRTDYIPCLSVEWLMLSEETASNPYNAFYDMNKKFISNFNTNIGYIKVPENAAYFVMSRAIGTEEFIVTPLSDVKATWEDGVAYTLTPFIENEYTQTDGTFIAYNAWKRTDYINCVHASKLTLSTGCQYGAFYNSKYELLLTVNGGRWTNTTEITVPVGACYFSVSNTNSIMDTLVITPSA